MVIRTQKYSRAMSRGPICRQRDVSNHISFVNSGFCEYVTEGRGEPYFTEVKNFSCEFSHPGKLPEGPDSPLRGGDVVDHRDAQHRVKAVVLRGDRDQPKSF